MKEKILDYSRRSGKTKALKEMLKGKKYILVKADGGIYKKTDERIQSYYKRLQIENVTNNIYFEVQEMTPEQIKAFDKFYKEHQQILQSIDDKKTT